MDQNNSFVFLIGQWKKEEAQVLKKTQVPPSGPQSCRLGVQEGLILLDTASCVTGKKLHTEDIGYYD